MDDTDHAPTADHAQTAPAPRPKLPSEQAMEDAILRVAGLGARSVAPEEVVRTLTERPDWQSLLPVLRRVALRMAREGRLVIYRKGKPADPDDLRGVYRLGLPTVNSEVDPG